MSRIEGADELIEGLQKLGAGMQETKEAMLGKGGEWLAAGWKDIIAQRDFIDNHDMLDNVKYKINTRRGIRAAVITSTGKDRHGVRNAAKAYYLHYGTSRIPASHWIDEVDKEYAPLAVEDMGRILSRKIEETIGG